MCVSIKTMMKNGKVCQGIITASQLSGLSIRKR